MSGSQMTVRTRLDNGTLVTTFVGDEVGDVIYSYGNWESPTVRLLTKLLEATETVFFDVGAHIGLYTLAAASLAREVHSFEPMPWVYRVLESNVKGNKLTNVFLNPMGIRDYTGTAAVWQGPKENSGSGSFLRIQGFYDTSHSVRCVTLDQYCKDVNLDLTARKVVLKIDAERSELEVLQGAAGLFDDHQPTLIFELNDWCTDLEEIVGFFEARNYSLQTISDTELRPFTSLAEIFPERRQSKAVNMLAQPSQA